MTGEDLLKEIGNIEEELVQEGNVNKKDIQRKKMMKHSLIAAAVCLCIFVGGGIAKASGFFAYVVELFAGEEESGYTISYEAEPIEEALFTGAVDEAREIIQKQYKTYQPYSSTSPSYFSKAFDTWDSVVDYLGVDFLENPLEELAQGGFVVEIADYIGLPQEGSNQEHIMLAVYGNEEGKLEHVLIESGYQYEDYRVQAWQSMTTDIAQDSWTNQTGAIITEYVEHEQESYMTKKGTEILLIESSEFESGVSSVEAYFVKGAVLHRISFVTDGTVNLEKIKKLLNVY